MESNGIALNGIEWNRMEWNGIEWNRMESNGIEWNHEWNRMEWIIEWNGMEWNGMEWNGMEWNGIVRFLEWIPLNMGSLNSSMRFHFISLNMMESIQLQFDRKEILTIEIKFSN